jgi:hypothetical protein
MRSGNLCIVVYMICSVCSFCIGVTARKVQLLQSRSPSVAVKMATALRPSPNVTITVSAAQALPAAVKTVNTAVHTLSASVGTSHQTTALRELVMHSNTLVGDPRVVCDFVALSQTLWEIIETYSRRPRSARTLPETLDAVAAAALLSRLLTPLSLTLTQSAPAKLQPTKPDLEAAMKFAELGVDAVETSGASSKFPATTVEMVFVSSMMLLGSVAAVDPVAVLKFYRQHAWPKLSVMSSAGVANVMLALQHTLLKVLAAEGSPSHQAVAKCLAEICLIDFDPSRFALDPLRKNTSSMAPLQPKGSPPLPAADAPRPAPATLNALAEFNSSLRIATLAIFEATNNSPVIRNTLKEAVVDARSKNLLSTTYLALVSALGEHAPLVALLAKLTGAHAAADATPLRLPFVSRTDQQLRGVLDSVEGTKILLVLNALYFTPGFQLAESEDLRPVFANDEAARKLVHVYFDEALRVEAEMSLVDEAKGIAPTGAASPRVVTVYGIVSAVATHNAEALRAALHRIHRASVWAHEACAKYLASGAASSAASVSRVRAVAAHAHVIQAVFRDMARAFAVAADAGRTSPGEPASPTASLQLSAADAYQLILDLALLQAPCLIHRSNLPKTTNSKQLAATDWQKLRFTASWLLDVVLRDNQPPSASTAPPSPPPQLLLLLAHLRRLTQASGMDRNVMVTEQVYFLAALLNHRVAIKAVPTDVMMRDWAGVAVKCILSQHSPALRQVGHILLAAPLVQKHPAATQLFPTYVDIFVSSPRNRRQQQKRTNDAVATGTVGTLSYGPVPADSLKLFSKYFRLIALALEGTDASAQAPEVDGPAVLKWGIGKLATTASYYLALSQPSQDDTDRRRRYFSALLDMLQLSHPVVLGAACAAIESLLLGLTNYAEAQFFLDYACGVVQRGTSVSTKKSMAEWLLGIRDKLQARVAAGGGLRSKL